MEKGENCWFGGVWKCLGGGKSDTLDRRGGLFWGVESAREPRPWRLVVSCLWLEKCEFGVIWGRICVVLGVFGRLGE